MDLGLAGRVAIITGGSEGIGRAAAESLGREGANVVICARRPDVLQLAAADVAESTGAQIVPIVADVSRAADVEHVVQATVERFGRLDILVNNAGRSANGEFEKLSDADWQDDLDLKLFGAIRAARASIPHMRAAGGGSIVNMLNLAAKAPGARSYPTSISRAAGLALTKALSKEFAVDNIRVNGIMIGLIKSGQNDRGWQRAGTGETLEAYYAGRGKNIPLGRVGEAAEVGDLIAFLCSTRGAYITGAAINMDGGTSAVV